MPYVKNLMNSGRYVPRIMVILIVSVIFLTPIPAMNQDAIIGTIDPVRNETLTATSFDVQNSWNSIFSSVSLTNLRALVKELSEDYPQRIWYPLDKAPSAPLAGAHAWANTTLSSNTQNGLIFRYFCEQMNLVAIKNGTNPLAAPIFIVGTISSRYSPGANYLGASVAAVIETARILDPMQLTNDVYYLLSNTNAGRFGGGNGDLGVQAMLNYLEDRNIQPAAIFAYHQLLASDNGESDGNYVQLSYQSTDNQIRQYDFIDALFRRISSEAGNKRLTQYSEGGHWWERSAAYQGWQHEIPGFVITQKYFDGYSGSEYDNFDAWLYDYTMAVEAVGLVASVIATLGQLGKGNAFNLEYSATMNPASTRTTSVLTTSQSYLNVSVSWSENTSLTARLLNHQENILYEDSSENRSLQINYLVISTGDITLWLNNTGNETAIVSYAFTHFHDYDRDGLNDYGESIIGTDSLSVDTDRDFIHDPDEEIVGTDPTNCDTDADTVLDGIEVQLGANPLSQDSDQDGVPDGYEYYNGMNLTSSDSDNDGLLDGFEVAMGLDPTSRDSDGDGLDDKQEIEYNLDPLSIDTDNDGLNDYFEVINGLNPLSSDSDNDGLSDLYEIENGLCPTNPDSDFDGIKDGEDFAPLEHWVNILPSVGLGVFIIFFGFWLGIKRHRYNSGETQ